MGVSLELLVDHGGDSLVERWWVFFEFGSVVLFGFCVKADAEGVLLLWAEVVAVGWCTDLWKRNRLVLTKSWWMLAMRKLVGLRETCPCVDWLKV